MTRQTFVDAPSQPVRNLVRIPQPTSGQWGVTGWPTGGAGTLTFPTGAGRRGNVACQRAWTALPIAGQPSATIVTASTFSLIGDVVPGQTYTGSIWVKLSAALPVCCDLWWLDAAGNSLGTAPRIGITAAANVWERRTATAVAPANAAKVHIGSRLTLMDGAPVGFTDWATDAGLFAGSSVPPTYVDGDTPGWSWDGAVNQSQSKGWPYTIPALAGTPASWFEADQALGPGVALPADNTALSQWNDLSGKGRHLTQAGSSSQPRLRSASLNLLRFWESVQNPDVGRWAARSNCTVAVSAATVTSQWPPTPPNSMAVTATADGDWIAETDWSPSAYTIPVSGNTQYSMEALVRAVTAVNRNHAVGVEWFDATPAFISNNFAPVGVPPNTNTRLTQTVTSPANAVWARLVLRGYAYLANEVCYAQRFGLYPAALPAAWVSPVTLFGGMPGVQFHPNSQTQPMQYMSNAGALPSSTAQHTIYVVCYVDGGLVDGARSTWEHISGAYLHRMIWNTTAQIRNDGALDDTTLQLVNHNLTETRNPQVYTARLGLPGMSGHQNGVGALHSVTPRTWTGSTKFVVGVRDGGSGGGWRGGIAAVLVYDGWHDDATRSRIEKWLGTKYAIAVV